MVLFQHPGGIPCTCSSLLSGAGPETGSTPLRSALSSGGLTVERPQIQPPTGTLGVLLPGMGAVATTFMAGVFAIRKGITKPIGSLTQTGHIRLGKRTEKRNPLVKDFVPLAGLDQLV